MTWWIWVIVGIILLSMELFAPSGFFIFFVGVGLILTGITSSVGLLHSLTEQLGFASVLTVALVFILRKKLVGVLLSPKGMTTDSRSIEGQTVTMRETIAPDALGRGAFRGTDWAVKNIGSVAAIGGERYLVTGRDGLTVTISPK